MVDLAGSERCSQTKSQGLRLKEGGHINKSLLTLGIVIRKLAEGTSNHIPYRESKLTRILQTALGGNSRTAILCCVTPASMHTDETISTLKFASRAKNIKNRIEVNEVVDDQTLIRRLKQENALLKRKLSCVRIVEVRGRRRKKARHRHSESPRLDIDVGAALQPISPNIPKAPRHSIDKASRRSIESKQGSPSNFSEIFNDLMEDTAEYPATEERLQESLTVMEERKAPTVDDKLVESECITSSSNEKPLTENATATIMARGSPSNSELEATAKVEELKETMDDQQTEHDMQVLDLKQTVESLEQDLKAQETVVRDYETEIEKQKELVFKADSTNHELREDIKRREAGENALRLENESIRSNIEEREVVEKSLRKTISDLKAEITSSRDGSSALVENLRSDIEKGKAYEVFLQNKIVSLEDELNSTRDVSSKLKVQLQKQGEIQAKSDTTIQKLRSDIEKTKANEASLLKNVISLETDLNSTRNESSKLKLQLQKQGEVEIKPDLAIRKLRSNIEEREVVEKALKDRIASLEDEIKCSQDESSAIVETLRLRLQKQEDLYSKSEITIQEIRSDMEKGKANEVSLRKNIVSLQDELHSTRDVSSDFKLQLQKQTDFQVKSDTTIQELRSNLGKAQATEGSLREKIASLESELASQRSSSELLDELKLRVQKQEELRSNSDATIQTLRSDIETRQAIEGSLQEKIASLESELASQSGSSELLDEFKLRIQKQEELRSSSDATIESLRSDIEARQAAEESLRERIGFLESELASHSSELLDEYELRLRKQEELVSTSDAAIQSLRSDLEKRQATEGSLRERIALLESELASQSGSSELLDEFKLRLEKQEKLSDETVQSLRSDVEKRESLENVLREKITSLKSELVVAREGSPSVVNDLKLRLQEQTVERSTLDSTIQGLRSDIEIRVATETALRQNLASLGSELESSRDESAKLIKALKLDLQKCEESRSQSSINVENLRYDLEKREAVEKSLRDEIASLTSELTASQRESSKTAKELKLHLQKQEKLCSIAESNMLSLRDEIKMRKETESSLREEIADLESKQESIASELATSLAESSTSIEGLKLKLQEQKGKNLNLNVIIQKLREEKEQKGTMEASLRGKIASLESDIDASRKALQSEISGAGARETFQKARMRALESKLAQLQQNITMCQEREEALLEAQDGLQRKIQDADKTIVELRERASTKESKTSINDVKLDLEEERQRVARREALVQKSKVKLKKLSEKLSSVNNERHRLKGEVDSLKSNMCVLKLEKKEFQEQIADYKNRVRELEKKVPTEKMRLQILKSIQKHRNADVARVLHKMTGMSIEECEALVEAEKDT
ncbi:hypothetical protein AAMO2058_001499900 [Amorphochlora amoebiformis]